MHGQVNHFFAFYLHLYTLIADIRELKHCISRYAHSIIPIIIGNATIGSSFFHNSHTNQWFTCRIYYTSGNRLLCSILCRRLLNCGIIHRQINDFIVYFIRNIFSTQSLAQYFLQRRISYIQRFKLNRSKLIVIKELIIRLSLDFFNHTSQFGVRK